MRDHDATVAQAISSPGYNAGFHRELVFQPGLRACAKLGLASDEPAAANNCIDLPFS